MAREGGSILVGVVVGILLTLGGIATSVLLLAVGGLGGYLLAGIGLGQALWILPGFLFFRRRGQMETGKGILIVAGLVFLLNATCWGLLASGKFRIGG